MKAIVMAAGKGTRISRYIQNIPKSTLPVDDTTLIRRNIEILINRGIKPIVCVGYQKEKIYEALRGLDVMYFYNPFFNITNSIASIWFAKDELNEDTLILNADVYFEEAILENILKDNRKCVLAVDNKRIEQGDYFLRTENGYIKKYGKDLAINERSCEYVGIGKIRKGFINEFKDKLECLIQNENYNLWWENILYSLVEDNEKIEVMDVDGLFWAEIDYFDDYERILGYIESKKEK